MKEPIPELLATRPQDERGYPIPYITYIDPSTHRPIFEVTRQDLRVKCVLEHRCPLCGKFIEDNIFVFVGGPLSAFDAKGGYLDPPSHMECARYSLKVCPFMAAPSYARITKIDYAALPPGTVFLPPDVLPRRPIVFVLVSASGYAMLGDFAKPLRPYLSVEYWRDGEQLNEQTARALAFGAVGSGDTITEGRVQ